MLQTFTKDNDKDKEMSDSVLAILKKYCKKSWFPNDIEFNVNQVVEHVINTLDPTKPFELKEKFTLLAELHKSVFQILF